MVTYAALSLELVKAPNDYGARLQDAMEHASVDAHALAKELKVSYQAVMKVINGGTKMLTAHNNSLAAAFLGVSSDWLATGSGARKISPPARQIAELIDRLGPPNSLPFLLAYEKVRRVLDKIEVTAPALAPTPAPPAQATRQLVRDKETRDE